jgi:hypothetical protein
MKPTTSWKSVNVLPTASAQPKVAGARVEPEGISKQDAVQPRMRVVANSADLPIPTLQSKVVPSKDLSQPPHKYYESRKVDSRAEAKGEARPSPKGIPQFVGSSFTHIPNAPNRALLPPSKFVTTARPQPVLTSAPYSQSSILNNRTPNGTILGSPQKKFVSEANVPYLPPDEPVGPDNPVKQLNETWSACWDKEAGAIYYYNNNTGEATWLKPEFKST